MLQHGFDDRFWYKEKKNNRSTWYQRKLYDARAFAQQIKQTPALSELRVDMTKATNIEQSPQCKSWPATFKFMVRVQKEVNKRKSSTQKPSTNVFASPTQQQKMQVTDESDYDDSDYVPGSLSVQGSKPNTRSRKRKRNDLKPNVNSVLGPPKKKKHIKPSSPKGTDLQIIKQEPQEPLMIRAKRHVEYVVTKTKKSQPKYGDSKMFVIYKPADFTAKETKTIKEILRESKHKVLQNWDDVEDYSPSNIVVVCKKVIPTQELQIDYEFWTRVQIITTKRLLLDVLRWDGKIEDNISKLSMQWDQIDLKKCKANEDDGGQQSKKQKASKKEPMSEWEKINADPGSFTLMHEVVTSKEDFWLTNGLIEVTIAEAMKNGQTRHVTVAPFDFINELIYFTNWKDNASVSRVVSIFQRRRPNWKDRKGIFIWANTEKQTNTKGRVLSGNHWISMGVQFNKKKVRRSSRKKDERNFNDDGSVGMYLKDEQITSIGWYLFDALYQPLDSFHKSEYKKNIFTPFRNFLTKLLPEGVKIPNSPTQILFDPKQSNDVDCGLYPVIALENFNACLAVSTATSKMPGIAVPLGDVDWRRKHLKEMVMKEMESITLGVFNNDKEKRSIEKDLNDNESKEKPEDDDDDDESKQGKKGEFDDDSKQDKNVADDDDESKKSEGAAVEVSKEGQPQFEIHNKHHINNDQDESSDNQAQIVITEHKEEVNATSIDNKDHEGQDNNNKDAAVTANKDNKKQDNNNNNNNLKVNSSAKQVNNKDAEQKPQGKQQNSTKEQKGRYSYDIDAHSQYLQMTNVTIKKEKNQQS